MNDSLRSTRQYAIGVSRWRVAFTLIELLFVMAVIAVLLAFLLPGATRNAGGAARRTQCKNNLKQIGLALHNYHEQHGAFPPAYTVNAEGRPLHSWRTLILPYLERHELYEKIDLTKPWDDPANRSARETRVLEFDCPSFNLEGCRTAYLAIVAPESCLRPTASRRLSEIIDDPAKTLMVIEVDSEHAVSWMAPSDADEQLLLSLRSSKGLAHGGIVHALKVDGSVEALLLDTPDDELRSRISVNGGERQTAGR